MLEVESPTLELDESLIDDKVRSELARVFIERIVDSAYVAPLGILLLAWLISMVSGWTTALLWASVMVVIELLIIVLGHYFNQTLAAERDAGL